MTITNDAQLELAMKTCAQACLDGIILECDEWMHQACAKFGWSSYGGGIADAWQGQVGALTAQYEFVPALLTLMQGNPWAGEDALHGSGYGSTYWDIRESFVDLLCNGVMPNLWGGGVQPTRDVWTEFREIVEQNLDSVVLKYGKAAGFNISAG